MNVPRARTERTASASDIAPAATSAEYSPSECPATNAGVTPNRFTNTACAATETARIAGWVFAVSLSSTSGPSKHSLVSFSPSASSAASSTAFASGKLS